MLKNWYKRHLGFAVDDWGCTFWWKDKNHKKASTQWSPFKKNSTYFAPSEKDFMFNYRVENYFIFSEQNNTFVKNFPKKRFITVKQSEKFVKSLLWQKHDKLNRLDLWNFKI